MIYYYFNYIMLKENEVKDVRLKFKENRNDLPSVFILTSFDGLKKESIWTKEKPSIQQLCRTVLLANQSLASLKKAIENFEPTEKIKVKLIYFILIIEIILNLNRCFNKDIFRPNTQIFDVEILLKVHYCVKAYQKIDIEKGTFLPHYKTYRSVGKDTNTYPVVGFDPVEMYVDELRKKFDEIAYFFYDSCGDIRIYMLWKRDQLKQIKEINKENRNLFIKDPIKDKIDLNLEAILEDLKAIGNELVDKINIKSTSLIFE